MAALAAAAAEPAPAVPVVALKSDGISLLYGKDERVIEAAQLLEEHLDITVLLMPGAAAAPPRVTAFPVVRGRIRNAKGALGGFEVTVDGYAAPDPSSRDELKFGAARDGAVSRCDIVVDLSGGARAATIESVDPDALGAALRALPATPPASGTAQFVPVGNKREVLRLSLRELHGVAPAPRDVVKLPADATIGTVV